MEQFLTLQTRKFNIINGNTVTLKEQTLFRSNGEEGLHLWESAIVMSRWSCLHPEIFKEKRVIELGSGCGLLGITLAKYINSKELILTDYMDSVLTNLKNNVEMNDALDKTTFLNLDWKEYETYVGFPKFDVIIGSELIYKGGPLVELANLIKILLKEDGVALISMPLKRSMTEVFSNFCNSLELDISGELLDDESLYKDSILFGIEDKSNKLFENLKSSNVMLYKITHKARSENF